MAESANVTEKSGEEKWNINWIVSNTESIWCQIEPIWYQINGFSTWYQMGFLFSWIFQSQWQNYISLWQNTFCCVFVMCESDSTKYWSVFFIFLQKVNQNPNQNESKAQRVNKPVAKVSPLVTVKTMRQLIARFSCTCRSTCFANTPTSKIWPSTIWNRRSLGNQSWRPTLRLRYCTQPLFRRMPQRRVSFSSSLWRTNHLKV